MSGNINYNCRAEKLIILRVIEIIFIINTNSKEI